MGAGVTLAKAIEFFDREVGVFQNRDSIIDAVTTQIEYLIENGGGKLLREWTLPLRQGRFTFPIDLETPVKYRLGNRPGIGLGVFNSPYYSYSSGAAQDCCGYDEWGGFACQILANRTPVMFQPPKCGGYVLLTTTDPRDAGKKVMVGGKQRGFDVAPTYNHYKTAGEILTIYLQHDPEKKHSQFIYDEINSITKDDTCNYVMLSGISYSTGEPFFLSHYHPDEATPMYNQGCIHNCPCESDCDQAVHILGRINPSIRYIRDEEILPITSYGMLELLAKRCRYDKAGDFEIVAAMEVRLSNMIRRQVMYQQAPGQDISFSLKGTGATLSNV